MVAVVPGFGRCPMRRIFLKTCRILSVEKHRGPGGARTHTGLMGADGHTDLTDEPHNHPNPLSHARPHTTIPITETAAADSTAAPPQMPVSVQKHRGEPVPVRVPVPARAESVAAAHGVLRCFSIYFQEAQLCMSRNCSSSSYYINNRQPNGSLSNEMNLNLNLNLNLRNCMYSDWKLIKRK
jgi:hypothetical protein